MTTLSPYQVTWIEFRAVNGVVTQKDAKILRKYNTCRAKKNGRKIMEHFTNKDKALEYLRSKKADFCKLGKAYEVRLCTDRQFAMATYPDFNIKFTDKQEKEMFTIGQ